MSSKNFFSSLKVLFALMFLSSCVNIGNNFSSETDWIIKGQTSKKDVLMLLGKPYKTGYSKGMTTWTYAHYDYKAWEKPAQKELKIYWQDDNLVKSYHFYSSFPSDVKKYSDNKAVAKKPANKDKTSR